MSVCGDWNGSYGCWNCVWYNDVCVGCEYFVECGIDWCYCWYGVIVGCFCDMRFCFVGFDGFVGLLVVVVVLIG